MNDLEKLKQFDLYNRRHRVFDILVSSLQEILKTRTIEDKQVLKLHTMKVQGYFLFEEDVSNYLDEVFKKADRLLYLRLFTDQKPANDKEAEEANKAIVEKNQIMKWFQKQFENLKSKFASYLDFRSVGKI